MQDTTLYRRNAIAAGIFFIIATAFLFVGEAFYKPPLQADDVLVAAAAAKSQIVVGILIEFLCIMAIPLVAISLYPVLKRVSLALAIGYVAFRLFEAFLFVGMELDRLFLLSLAEAYVANPIANTETLQVMAAALTPDNAWSHVPGTQYNLVFMIGAWMLYGMLWTSRLIPRWISGWGIVSVTLLGGLSVLVQFVHVPDNIAVPLIAPLAIQEMVMAIWFIWKGFDADAVKRLATA